MMHHITALYDLPADPAAFRNHYETVHIELAAKLPGLRSMHHSFDLQQLTEGPGYFCIWTGIFEDAAAADAALASPEGEALAADIPNYVTAGMQLFRYSTAETAA